MASAKQNNGWKPEPALVVRAGANGGREWEPEGEPTRTLVHDFADRALGEFAKAIPYGIYDVAYDDGWVSGR